MARAIPDKSTKQNTNKLTCNYPFIGTTDRRGRNTAKNMDNAVEYITGALPSFNSLLRFYNCTSRMVAPKTTATPRCATRRPPPSTHSSRLLSPLTCTRTCACCCASGRAPRATHAPTSEHFAGRGAGTHAAYTSDANLHRLRHRRRGVRR